MNDPDTDPAIVKPVHIYSSGPFMCAVCAAPDLTPEEVVDAVNKERPYGPWTRWKLSSDGFLSDGKTRNGETVNCGRLEGPAKHWLLETFLDGGKPDHDRP